MPGDSRIGIVIPAFNESENLAELCEQICTTYGNADVLIVDDSPGDESLRLVEAIANSRIKLLHRKAKLGRGSAVAFGLRQMLQQKYKYYIEMDADFSHNPGEIKQLLAFAEQTGSDIVISSRYMPGGRIVNWPWSRRLFSRMANILLRALLGIPVSDYTTGFRVYSAKACEQAIDSGKKFSGFIVLSEILVRAHAKGLKISEQPGFFSNRIRGNSSFSFSEVIDSVKGLAYLFGLQRKLRLKGELL